MITYKIDPSWVPLHVRHTRRVRKIKQMQIRARRMIFEMRKRERVFPPGPYWDADRPRFLGRANP